MPPFPLNPRGVGERTLFVQVPCHNEAETLQSSGGAPRSVKATRTSDELVMTMAGQTGPAKSRYAAAPITRCD